MSRTISRRPAAIEDVVDIVVHLSSKSPQAARRFFEQLQVTLDELCLTPTLGYDMGHSIPELAGLRRYGVRGFANYLVFYRVTARSIVVIRVIHGGRNYLEWIARE